MKPDLYKDSFLEEISKMTQEDWRAALPAAPSTGGIGGANSGLAGVMALHDAETRRLEAAVAAQAKNYQREQQQQARAAIKAQEDGGFDLSGLRTFEEAIASQEGFNDLDYEKKMELYGDYVREATQAVQSIMPESNPQELRDLIEERNEPPAMPKKAFFKDLVSGLGTAAVDVAGHFEQLARMAVGDDSRAVLLEVADGLRDLRSEHFQDAQLRKMRKMAEFLEANPDASTTQQNVQEFVNALDNFTTGDTGEVIGGLASLIFGGALSAGARTGVRSLAGRSASQAAGKRSLRQTFTPGKTDMLLIDVADTAGAHIDRIMQQLNELSMDEFRQRVGDDAWGNALSKFGGDEEQARKYITQNASRYGAAAAGSISAAADLLPFSPVSLLNRMIRPNGTVKPMRALVLSPATAIGSNVSSTVGSSAAAGLAGADVESEGLGELAAISGVQGLFTGGGAAARSRGASRRPAGEVSIEDLLGEGADEEGTPTPTGTVTQLVNAAGDRVDIRLGEDGTWAYIDGDQPVDSTTDSVLETLNRQSEPAPAPAGTPAPAPAGTPAPAPAGTPAPAPAGTPTPEAEPEPRVYVEPEGVTDMSVAQQEVDLGWESLYRSDGTSQGRTRALSHIYQTILGTTPEERLASRSQPQTPIGRAIHEAGIGVLIADRPDAPWVEATRQGDGVAALEAAANDTENMGQSNANAARQVLQAYQEAEIPVPSTRVTSPSDRGIDGRTGILGMYRPQNHDVTLAHSIGTANTLVHEMLHGLTAKGLTRIRQAARESGPEQARAKGLLDLLEAVRQQVADSASTQTRAVANLDELFAEMGWAESMQAAATTQFDESGLSENAKNVLESLRAKPDDSLFDIFSRLIAAAVNFLTGRETMEAGTIGEVLSRAAAETVRTTATTFTPSETSTTGETPTTGDVVNGYPVLNTRRGNSSGFPAPMRLLNGLRSVVTPRPAGLPEPLGANISRSARWDHFKTVVGLYLDGVQVRMPRDPNETATLRMNTFGGFDLVTSDGIPAASGLSIFPTGSDARPQLRVSATGATAGSGVGGPIYRAIFVAAANAGFTIYNDVLFAANQARLPLNRLKGILLAAMATDDIRKAHQALAINPTRLWAPQSNLSDVPEWVTERGVLGLPSLDLNRNLQGLADLVELVIRQTEHYLPTQGELSLNQDGTIQTPDGPKLPSELREWLDLDNRLPWADGEPNASSGIAYVRGTQSPSAVILAALMRSWKGATTTAERNRVISAAQQLEGVELFSEDGMTDIFSLTDEDLAAEFEGQTGPEGEGEQPAPRRTLTKTQRLERGDAAAEQGAENLTGDPSQDRRAHSPRGGAIRLIRDIEADNPASPASMGRELRQARSWKDTRSALRKMTSRLNELFHTNLEPVHQFLNNIIASDSSRLELLGERVRNALHAAPVVRDYFTTAVRTHGGRSLEEGLAKLASSAGITEETAVKYAGYLATAVWIPQANQRLIDRRAEDLSKASAAVTRARQEVLRSHARNPDTLSAETAQAMRAADQAEVEESAARTELLSFIALVNGNVNTDLSAAKLAGGMNNAQANRLRRVIESKFDVETLDSIRESLYDMNAYKLAMDIESGKTAPEVAAKFLGLTENKRAMSLMDNLYLQGRRGGGDNILELEALRKNVAGVVRTEYVPLSGDPLTAVDSDLLQADSAAPNVGANRRMEGRTSIANDGITESLAQVFKSANYAGWRPFQESLARLYSSMTNPERHKAGFSRGTIGRPGTSITRSSVILRDGTGGVVFNLPDKVMDAIRKTNVEDAGGVMRFLGKPTQVFAYGATQLNPVFAPKNWLRDVWERSEIIRKYKHVRNADGDPVDMNKAARSMLASGLMNPSIFAATARFAAGRPAKDTPADRAIHALARDGGLSTYGERFGLDRGDLVKRIARQKSMTRKGLAGLHKLVDIYNKSFDLVSSTAAYLALQEQGVSSKDASAIALDTMNFRKKGTIMPQVSILYAFAQPAVTSGANMWSTIFDSKTGAPRPAGMARLASYVLAFAALQGFVRSLDEEDEGGAKLDQLSSFQKMASFNFIADDTVYSIPLAFGLPRLANGLVLNSIEVANNNKTIGEAASDFIGENMVPAFSPIQATDIDPQSNPFQFLMSTFSPTVVKPMASVGIGMTDFGSPLRPAYPKAGEFMSDQGNRATAQFWRDTARFIREYSGVDMTPEEVRALGNGYAVGIIRTALNSFVENPNKERRGLPVGNPLLAGVVSPRGDHSIVAQYYEARSRLNGLHKKETTYGRASLTTDERQLLRMYDRITELDRTYQTRAAAITRSAKAETTKERERHVLQEGKRQEMYRVVRDLRRLENKVVGEVSSFRRRPLPQ